MNGVQKMKKSILSVLLTLAFASTAAISHAETNVKQNEEFCGRKVDLGLFMLDYSGSMQVKDEEGVTKLQKSIGLIEDVVKLIPANSHLKMGVTSFGPHVLLIEPVEVTAEQMSEKLSALPVSREIFGRHTNPGEGLAGFANRIETLKSGDENEKALAATFEGSTSMVIVTDGGKTNRGRDVAEVWETFHAAYPGIKPVVLSTASTDEEREGVELLAQTLKAPIYEVGSLTQNPETLKEFVGKELYVPCDFTFGADALFAFDKATLSAEGKKSIREFAKALKSRANDFQEDGIRFEISAHTDRLGSEAYNMNLSQRRLETVLREFEKNGIKRSYWAKAEARGESEPVTGTMCDGISGKRLIDCLQPDRRMQIKEVR